MSKRYWHFTILIRPAAALLAMTANSGWACEMEISGDIGANKIDFSCKASDLCKHRFSSEMNNTSFDGYVEARFEKNSYIISGNFSKDKELLFNKHIELAIPASPQCTYEAHVDVSINVSPVSKSEDLVYYLPQFADIGNITISER